MAKNWFKCCSKKISQSYEERRFRGPIYVDVFVPRTHDQVKDRLSALDSFHKISNETLLYNNAYLDEENIRELKAYGPISSLQNNNV